MKKRVKTDASSKKNIWHAGKNFYDKTILKQFFIEA
jgi:hypothetical protein